MRLDDTMTFEEAKAVLIANTVGHNEYDRIVTWEALSEAVENEMMYAEDRLRSLSYVASLANENTGDSL